jgi:thioredoxin
MKLKYFPLLLLAFLVLCCQAKQTTFVETLDVPSFSEKLNATKTAQLLDVRTPEEFSLEHLENAINLNWYEHDFAEKAGKYDKSKPIFVYCKAGNRSLQAAKKLATLGFQKVYNLDGGLMKWNVAHHKPAGPIIGMHEDEFFALTKTKEIVLVDFYAEWCGPCRKMAPFLTQMQLDLKDNMSITRIDVDRNPTIAEQLHIESLPLLLLYKNGKEIWRHVGYISENELNKTISKQ